MEFVELQRKVVEDFLYLLRKQTLASVIFYMYSTYPKFTCLSSKDILTVILKIKKSKGT